MACGDRDGPVSAALQNIQGGLRSGLETLGLLDVPYDVTDYYADPAGSPREEDWMQKAFGSFEEFLGLGEDPDAQNTLLIDFQSIAHGVSSKFKGFLTNFEDQYSSAWKDVDTFGRMDPIVTFQGTRRQINFSFDVPAWSYEQAKQNYTKSRQLLSHLYPRYDSNASATSLVAPPMFRIRFANLVAERSNALSTAEDQYLVGKLGGLAYSPNLDMGFFEGDDKFPDEPVLYPKVNSFTCNFTVFHSNKLGVRVQASEAAVEPPPESETEPGSTRQSADGVAAANERRVLG